MGRRIEAIKRVIQSSPQEVMAGFLYHNVVNSRDHFWKTKYYKYTAYFELNHENDAYMIDVLYLGQEASFNLNTFMKTFPDYGSVLAITGQLLSWLENTYAVNTSALPEPPRPRKGRRNRVANRQQIANSVMDLRVQNTPRGTQQRAPQNGRAKTS